jgi:hypothetical protein
MIYRYIHLSMSIMQDSIISLNFPLQTRMEHQLNTLRFCLIVTAIPVQIYWIN